MPLLLALHALGEETIPKTEPRPSLANPQPENSIPLAIVLSSGHTTQFRHMNQKKDFLETFGEKKMSHFPESY